MTNKDNKNVVENIDQLVQALTEIAHGREFSDVIDECRLSDGDTNPPELTTALALVVLAIRKLNLAKEKFA